MSTRSINKYVSYLIEAWNDDLVLLLLFLEFLLRAVIARLEHVIMTSLDVRCIDRELGNEAEQKREALLVPL